MKKLVLVLVLLGLIAPGFAHAVDLTDAGSHAEVVPPAPAAGDTVADQLGGQILRVTSNADGNCRHAYSTYPAMNRDNTRVLAACGFPITAMRTWIINPTTFTLTGTGPLLTASPIFGWEGAQWDQSGTKDNEIWDVPSANTEVNRILRKWNVSTGVQLGSPYPFNFSASLRQAFTVTSGTSKTVFAVAGIPVNASDTGFVNMRIKWDPATPTAGLRNDNVKISGFVSATGTFTISAAMDAQPVAGDFGYIFPAGFQFQIMANGGGRYVAIKVSEADQASANVGNTLVVIDTGTTPFTVYTRVFSNAEMGNGIDEVRMHPTDPLLHILSSTVTLTGIYNFVTNTYTVGGNSSHGDTGQTGMIRPTESGTYGDEEFRAWATPLVAVTPVFRRPLKQGKVQWVTAHHVSWPQQPSYPNAVVLGFYVVTQLTRANLTLYSGTVGVDAIYTYANYTGINSSTLPLTQANQGEVRHNGAVLSPMGEAVTDASTAGLITGDAQWAYNTKNSKLFIQGTGAVDLTLAAHYVIAFDWRWGDNEIVKVYFDTAGAVTNLAYRACHTYTGFATSGPSTDTYFQTPRASASWDGRFVVFDSTWAGTLTNGLGVFICKLDRVLAALVTPAALVSPAPLVSPVSGIVASTVVTVPR